MTHVLTSKDGRSTLRMHNSGRWTTALDGVTVSKGPLVPDGTGGWKLIDPIRRASLPPPPNPAYRWGAPVRVLRRGAVGEPDRYFAGISPCQVRKVGGDTLKLFYVGADSLRPDGGPAHRKLLQAFSTRGGSDPWAKDASPVKVWSPQNNEEEGVFGMADDLFSAITAANKTTTSVWSDARRLPDDKIMISAADPKVWNYGDEIFPIAVLSDGRILYISKGRLVAWGLAERFPDGGTKPFISPRTPAEEVWGGSYFAPYVLLAVGRDNTEMQWYHEDDLTNIIHRARIGSLHAAPFWNGTAWEVYWRKRDGNEIWRSTLEKPQPNPNDEIDLTTVIWHHTDPSAWTQNSTVTGVSTPREDERPVCIHHTRASGPGAWPTYIHNGNKGQGNPWVFFFIRGRWHAATFEWLRPGQECKGVTRRGSTSIGRHTKQPPMEDYVPGHGEICGFMMSTQARDGGAGSQVHRRSNVVAKAWS